MSEYLSNPVSQLLDGVGSYGAPPPGELDALIEKVIRGSTTPLTADDLKGRLDETVKAMTALQADGRYGEARNVGRSSAQAICAELGPFRPPPDDRPVAEIVAGIRRDPFDQRGD